MSGPAIIALGGVVSALVSALVCYMLVPRLVAKYLPTLIEPTPQEEQMTQPEHKGPTTTTVIIVALVAVICVISVQVWFSSRAQHHNDAKQDQTLSCVLQYAAEIETWANGDSTHQGVTDVLQARGEATHRLRNRDKAWHKRDDAILQLLFRANGGEDLDPDEVQAVIDGYQQARERLFRAYDKVDETAAQYPYPTLSLNCVTGGVEQ